MNLPTQQPGMFTGSIDEAFPTKHLSSGDLGGQDRTVVMSHVMQEEIGDTKELKPVLYFTGIPKGLVLNKTNATTIAGMYGSTVAAWQGKQVTLYPTETQFGAEMKKCIRIRSQPPTQPEHQSMGMHPVQPQQPQNMGWPQ